MPSTTEARVVDPTRTTVLRKRYRQHYRRMWQRVNTAINEFVDGVDFDQPLAVRLMEFNRFVDALLQREFGNAENDRDRGVRSMVLLAYMRGIAQANTEVDEMMPPPQQAVYDNDHDAAIAALILLLSTDFLTVRSFLTGQILDQYRRANNAAEAKFGIRDRILKSGRTPTDRIASDGVVRTYNDALLNTYEAAGTQYVGVIEEKMFFQTAEDRRVCERCWRLSQRVDNGYGPGIYTIAQARGLIPVHGRCRCRWRRLPLGVIQSQGLQPAGSTRQAASWRLPVELAPQNRNVQGLRRK